MCHMTPVGVSSLLKELIQGTYAGCDDKREAMAFSMRLLCHAWDRVRGHAQGGMVLRPETAHDEVNDLDMVLTKIKQVAKREGVVDIVAGKAWLRSFGSRGRAAASKLSKLSTCRNFKSHPITRQLLAEIDLLIASCPSEVVGT